MDLFNFIDANSNSMPKTELPLYKEVAWNYEKNIPILENGTFKIVEGIEAIKTWVYKALSVERFRYIIYTHDYGNELDKLIGEAYTPSLSTAEGIRYIKEALLINPYIKNIKVLDSSFREGRILSIKIELDTIYGKEEVSI